MEVTFRSVMDSFINYNPEALLLSVDSPATVRPCVMCMMSMHHPPQGYFIC